MHSVERKYCAVKLAYLCALFEQPALRLTDAPALEQVELLPYHVTAGAKYAMVGRQYRPEFDTAAAPNLNTGIFLAHGIACTHL